MKHWTLAATLSLALASGAFAQTETPRVDQRQAHQQQRIDQGVASGSLTGTEATRLHHGQARVAAAESQAKADGAVTQRKKRISRTCRKNKAATSNTKNTTVKRSRRWAEAAKHQSGRCPALSFSLYRLRW